MQDTVSTMEADLRDLDTAYERLVESLTGFRDKLAAGEITAAAGEFQDGNLFEFDNPLCAVRLFCWGILDAVMDQGAFTDVELGAGLDEIEAYLQRVSGLHPAALTPLIEYMPTMRAGLLAEFGYSAQLTAAG